MTYSTNRRERGHAARKNFPEPCRQTHAGRPALKPDPGRGVRVDQASPGRARPARQGEAWRNQTGQPQLERGSGVTARPPEMGRTAREKPQRAGVGTGGPPTASGEEGGKKNDLLSSLLP